MPELVLASTSPYRRQLLERLGMPFRCEAPGVDEAAVKVRLRDPLAVASELARLKASTVARRHPQAIVIGSDQVATEGGTLLDKPGTAIAASAQLRRLANREHRLHTAVAIAHQHGLVEFVDTAVLHMRPLSEAEITRYVAAESPLDCAGSYKIEGLGIALFQRVECSDHTAITGLPLLRLAAELRALGVAIP